MDNFLGYSDINHGYNLHSDAKCYFHLHLVGKYHIDQVVCSADEALAELGNIQFYNMVISNSYDLNVR